MKICFFIDSWQWEDLGYNHESGLQIGEVIPVQLQIHAVWSSHIISKKSQTIEPKLIPMPDNTALYKFTGTISDIIDDPHKFKGDNLQILYVVADCPIPVVVQVRRIKNEPVEKGMFVSGLGVLTGDISISKLHGRSVKGRYFERQFVGPYPVITIDIPEKWEKLKGRGDTISYY